MQRYFLVLMLLVAVVGEAFGAGTFRLVASEGSDFPVLESIPSIDALGRVSFYVGPPFSELASGAQDGAIFRETSSGDLQPAMQTGQTPSGAPEGSRIEQLGYNFGLNQTGQLAARVTFDDGRDGFLIGNGDTVRAVIVTETPTPDLPGFEFITLHGGDTPLNAYGETAFLANHWPQNNPTFLRTSIWTDAGGTGLRRLAREGDEPSDLQAGEYLSSDQFDDSRHGSEIAIDDIGRTAFAFDIGRSGLGFAENAVWVHEPENGLRLVAREGDDLAGMPLSEVYNVTLNNRGEIGFISSERDASPTTGLFGSFASEAGIVVRNAGGSFRSIVKTRTSVPDEPEGVIFESIRTNKRWLNDRGEAVFAGKISSLPFFFWEGLWLANSQGEIESIFNPYQRTPDEAEGIERFFYRPVLWDLNDVGEVAFIADSAVVGFFPGVVQSIRRSLWIRSELGVIERIVSEGDQLPITINGETTLGTIRSIASRSLSSDSANGRFFNDAGQVAFFVRFENGASGIYIYTPVPEPASAVLAASFLLAMGLNRRRQIRRGGDHRLQQSQQQH